MIVSRKSDCFKNDAGQFFAAMERVIADPSVKIVRRPRGRPAGPPSGVGTDLFRALEAATRQMCPQAATLPVISTGATDMAQLRAKAMQRYGIGPETTDEKLDAHGWHSDVERITATTVSRLV